MSDVALAMNMDIRFTGFDRHNAAHVIVVLAVFPAASAFTMWYGIYGLRYRQKRRDWGTLTTTNRVALWGISVLLELIGIAGLVLSVVMWMYGQP